MAKNGILAKSQDLQPSFQTTTEQITIGIDLGDRFSHCCVLGPDGRVLTEGRVRSTPERWQVTFKIFRPRALRLKSERTRAGQVNCWPQWGHEVIVANPRNLRMIADSIRKSDQVDAHMLARLARVDPNCSPPSSSEQETYPDMIQLKARDLLVRNRTRLMNAVRGVLKAVGPRCLLAEHPPFRARPRCAFLRAEDRA